MTHGSRSNEAFPRQGVSNLARSSGSQGPADGGPAYSNYMKSKILHDRHPEPTAADQVNYKYLAPNFSLSDSQPQRVGVNATSAAGLEQPDLVRTSLSPKEPASYYKLNAASIYPSICMSDDYAQSEHAKPPFQVQGSVATAAAAQMRTNVPTTAGASASLLNPPHASHASHASFRSRIENLLPDRLRDQYHVQQQQLQARQSSLSGHTRAESLERARAQAQRLGKAVSSSNTAEKRGPALPQGEQD